LRARVARQIQRLRGVSNIAQRNKRRHLPSLVMQELFDQRGSELFRLCAQQFFLPAKEAGLRLRRRLLPTRNIELLAHEPFFVPRTSTKHSGEMLDTALARVGGFRRRHAVWDMPNKRNVLTLRGSRDRKIGVSAENGLYL